jgi:hypothetical protein
VSTDLYRVWPFYLSLKIKPLSHGRWLYDMPIVKRLCAVCQASMCGDHRISPSVQESTGFCRQFICYYLFFPVLFPHRRKQSRSVYRVSYFFSPWLAKPYKCSYIFSHIVVMRMRNIPAIWGNPIAKYSCVNNKPTMKTRS